MIQLDKAFTSRRIIRSLTGLDLSKFNKLLLTFTLVLEKTTKKNSKATIRKIGGGRHHTLPTAKEKLFYILFYMKCYPTYDLAGFLFESDRSQACRWVKELLPILQASLDRELVLPKRKLNSVKEFVQYFPGVKDIFIDGTERPVQRPTKDKRQAKHYSGKKKRHTKKNIIVTTQEKEILIVTKTKCGSQHDMRMLRKSELPQNIPKQVSTWVDTGFIGLDKETESTVFIPAKKSKNKPLTKKQKQDNYLISGLRVCNEQAIGGMKRMRCVSDVSRTKSDKLADELMLNSAGIWNFHLKVA